jgi:hypothetical protein
VSVKVNVADVLVVGFAGPDETVGVAGAGAARASPAIEPRTPSKVTMSVTFFAVLRVRSRFTGSSQIGEVRGSLGRREMRGGRRSGRLLLPLGS